MATTGKPITCRAAVSWGPKSTFVIETVQVAPPKANEVRIKIVSSGLCHSDLVFLEGADPEYPFPSVMGHEGAGIVESVGEGVKNLTPGDSVVLLFEGYCGECAYCKSRNTNLCMKTPRNALQLDGTCRITCKGKQLSQFMSVGCFSEFTVVNEIQVTKVNSNAPLKQLCLISCCIPTGYGAPVKSAKVTPDSTCAVWGLGGVGMAAVMGCRDQGAYRIIGIDFNPKKFPLAKELGCTDVINPKDLSKSVPEVLADMTSGGVDYCFVAVGATSAMEEAFNSSHPAWGSTIIIGVTEKGKKMQTGVWELLRGRSLKGTFYGDYKAKLDIPSLVDKVIAGQIQLDKLITHVLPLDKINEGFQLMKSGDSLRAIINFALK